MNRQTWLIARNLAATALAVASFIFVEAKWGPDAQAKAEQQRLAALGPLSPWRTDLNAALAESKKTGKPIMADFSAPW